MVNNNFEIEWWNAQAADAIFHRRKGLAAESEARNLFRLLLEARQAIDDPAWNEIMSLHMGVAKNRIKASSFARLAPEVGGDDITLLRELHDDTPAIEKRHVMQAPVQLGDGFGATTAHDLYASFFREGVLFAYLPSEAESGSLLDFLSRREQVIRDLFQKRLPVLTHLAVLVADFENSPALASELPPEAYFELVNDIWGAMEPVFRNCYGTHGKHLSDGLTYYFFPQPDCNYVMNAITCACELRQAMGSISLDWQVRRQFMSDLHLNIGLNEGHEWFGGFHTRTQMELTVLGDTTDKARQLARSGSSGKIFATKDMLGILTEQERARVHYGVRWSGGSRPDVFAPALLLEQQ